ncbi:MAG: hypothetical protein R2862_11835 [Thermoanaerobaculia bacterium]
MKRPLRLAWASPLPPSSSGIADYSAEVLPLLAERAEVTLFHDDGEGRRVAAEIGTRFPCRSLAALERRAPASSTSSSTRSATAPPITPRSTARRWPCPGSSCCTRRCCTTWCAR